MSDVHSDPSLPPVGNHSASPAVHRTFMSTLREDASNVRRLWREGDRVQAVVRGFTLPQQTVVDYAIKPAVFKTAGAIGDEVGHVATEALPVINKEVIIFGALAIGLGYIALQGMKEVNSITGKIL